MEHAEILEQIKNLSFKERLEIAKETMKLIREALMEKAQAPVQLNGEETRALSSLLRASRKLAQPLDAEIKRQMEESAKLLLPDYLYDKELTAFTALDGEPVYDYDEYESK